MYGFAASFYQNNLGIFPPKHVDCRAMYIK